MRQVSWQACWAERKLKRVKSRAILGGMLGVAVVGGWLQACSSPATPSGQGDTCEQATDCQEGLACIPQANGTRQCSSDFTPVQTTEEAGVTQDAPAQQEAAPGDGTTPPPDGTTPTPDTGGNPPPDTGSPPKDSGSPPPDTGSPPPDTGSPPPDTGTGDAAGD
jgi:hypothetical protein